jgi:uncharacterized protein (TIGR02302 family)
MTETTEASLLAQIRTPLRLTWAGLWAERVTRAFWPLWTLAIASLSALAFGLQDYLPLEISWFFMVLAVLGTVWALVHGIRAFRKPSRTEALVRLDSRMPGQPIAALLDAQAIGAEDEASRAVWQAHRSRMATRLRSARAVEPDLRLAARDPFALRYVALTALVMAVLFGSIWRVTTLAGIVPGPANAASGPAWEGWAKPPSYTGKPALYLNDQTDEAITLPSGTKLQIRLYGQPGALILDETVSGRTEAPAASEPVQDFTVAQSGKLAIKGSNGREWQVIATPDRAPAIKPDAKIGREADGRFKQKFSATDDYGVTKGQASLALNLAEVDRRFGLATAPEEIAPVVLDLPLPVKGSRAEVQSMLVDDLSKSVLSNLPVTITYAVTDAAGQTGTAAPINVVLPGKRFFDPLADAIIEMRRDILWSRQNAATSAQILKAVQYRAEDDSPDGEALKRLRVAIKRLDAEAASLTPKSRDEIAEELWQVSLMIEDGQLNSAKDRLKRAQDRVSEAIRKGASPEEMQALMDEMKKALDDYMREEAKKNPQDPNDETSPQGQQGPTITQDQIQQMMDKIQQLMEEGKTAEAAEAMQQLQQLLENMKVQQGQGQGQGQSGPGGKAMKDLGQTLRDQQGLSDDAFKDLQDGQEGDAPGGKSLAERQKELRQKLGQMEKGGDLPGQGKEKGQTGRDKLGDAGRSMEEAERALRDGDLPGALDKQAEAMDKMRQGLRDFGDALAEEQRKEGSSPDGDKLAEADPNGTRDPLGRENSARIGSDKNLLQGEDVYRRAQELLDEIRKRSGEQNRPETERNYLKRLLDLF